MPSVQVKIAVLQVRSQSVAKVDELRSQMLEIARLLL